MLSSTVELNHNREYVRAGHGSWQQFVLPDAPRSLVEMTTQEGQGEVYVDDEEEEEVEFVMNPAEQDRWQGHL